MWRSRCGVSGWVWGHQVDYSSGQVAVVLDSVVALGFLIRRVFRENGLKLENRRKHGFRDL